MRAARKLAFVDVDTQYDFMYPAGALYVPGAIDIVPNLEKLSRYACEHKVPVIASVDAHTEDDPEFANFPPHCVRNTAGQEKITATTLPASVICEKLAPLEFPLKGNVVLEKRIFSLFGNENAEAIFRSLDAEKYVVFGVATDYCVKAAVLGLLQRGYHVAVVEDAIRGVDVVASKNALLEMKDAGAEIVNTAEVLAWGD